MIDIVLGIDPGINGAIAFYGKGDPLDSGADHFTIFDMPTFGDGKRRAINDVLLANIISQFQPRLALVEKVNAMRGWGVGSTWRFAQSYGTVLGILGALKIPKDHISPQKWKKHYGLPGGDKEASRRYCIEHWPFCQTLWARVKDHNRAEAALIAAYAKQKLKEFVP
jgi:crossover junction endodeoxyribonuclease RuvC